MEEWVHKHKRNDYFSIYFLPEFLSEWQSFLTVANFPPKYILWDVIFWVSTKRWPPTDPLTDPLKKSQGKTKNVKLKL